MKIFRKLLDLITVSIVFAQLASFGFAQSTGGRFANAQIVGAEDPSRRITVTVWLKQRNKAAFDELVREMYRPGSPQYHHFLTHEQYRAQFAPSSAAAAQVQEYVKANHLAVTSVDKYNHYVVARGRVSDVQNAFNVRLNRINLKGNAHRVSDAEATISGPVGELVRGVTRLDDFAPHPAAEWPRNRATGDLIPPRPFSMAGAAAQSSQPNNCLAGHTQVSFTTKGGGPSATYSGNLYNSAPGFFGFCPPYTPAQLQTAYGLNSLYEKGWDGTGQTIIITDAWGSNTIEQDANTFSAAYGLPPLTSSNFQIYYPGGKVRCGQACRDGIWNVETSIDVEWAHAIAPGADIVLIVAPDNLSLETASFWAIENAEQIPTPYANGDLGYVISNSWLAWELVNSKSLLDTDYEMTELAAALGMSANYASGDNGDLVQAIYQCCGLTVPPSVSSPASTPYATGVGGISLFLHPDGKIQYQIGWGYNSAQITGPSPYYYPDDPPLDPPMLFGFSNGSGGGSSAIWPEPDFQSGLGNAYRQVPDISWLADSNTGATVVVSPVPRFGVDIASGTSLATPMFSALWAIANQAAGAKAPLGQAAPMLYSLPPGAITDVVPVSNAWNVKGKIFNPPQPVLVETADDLAQPLENTTTFLTAFYHQSYKGVPDEWYVLTFGTDTSLVTAPGWDNVTGLGVPNGLKFVQDVVAAAP